MALIFSWLSAVLGNSGWPFVWPE